MDKYNPLTIRKTRAFRQVVKLFGDGFTTNYLLSQLIELSIKSSWEDNIDSMFTWSSTPQGHYFWSALDLGELEEDHPLYKQHMLFKETGVPQ